MFGSAEYIWMDGNEPVQTLRSKTRVFDAPSDFRCSPENFPVWSFDGSSTNQSSGEDSDLILQPVRAVPDPIRGEGNFLVLCEVNNGDGTPHETNTRAKLRALLDAGAENEKPWFGFEQEYTLFQGQQPLGWPAGGSPKRPQGPYYCGVGADEVAGRQLVEAHLQACLRAGIMIYGINAEVMLGQWEFQIGYRGSAAETPDPLTASDHLWIARWLLYRLGENYGIHASLSCKPEQGDWNGAGCHTNFSTDAMRDRSGQDHARNAINNAVEALSGAHSSHIAEYGHGLEDRLTGQHETCSINEFKAGVANRAASIRIPRQVHEQGHGYIEDRRPGANCDPYRVCARILETICAVPA